MDTSTTEGKIAVMQAHLEGKKIESKERHDRVARWYDGDRPTWNWCIYDYRVKELLSDEIIVFCYTDNRGISGETMPFRSYERADKYEKEQTKRGYTVTSKRYKEVKE